MGGGVRVVGEMLLIVVDVFLSEGPGYVISSSYKITNILMYKCNVGT